MKPTVARVVFTVSAGAASTGGGGTSTGGGSSSSTKPATKPDTTPDPIGSVLGTLSGGVDTVGKLTLTYKGKGVSSLKAGRYRITVLDETSRTGFTLQKLGKAGTNLTSKPFLGKRTVTLTLKAGQWFYFSPAKKKTGFVVHA